LLREEAERGLVEQTPDGRWRLTRAAEEGLGKCLRELEAPT
jgi:hypothetical protein